MAQSGAGSHALTPATASRVAGYLAEHLDVPATREALAGVSPEALLAAQRALSVEVQTMPDPEKWGEITLNQMVFEPVVDGDVLPALPLLGARAGAGADVDLLVGTNSDEQTLFLVPSGRADAVTPELLDLVLLGYGLAPEAAAAAYRTLAPAATPGDILTAAATGWFFRLPALRLAEARAAGPGGTWVYELAWPTPQFDGRLGATHALEITFVFDNLHLPEGEPLQGPHPPQELADAMHGAWVAIARDGDPGWPRYDLDARPVQVFGVPTAVVPDPRSEQRQLWEGVR